MRRKIRSYKTIFVAALTMLFLSAALLTTAVAKESAATITDTSIVPRTHAPSAVDLPAEQSGCSGTPVISSFTASPSTIQPGETAILSWGPVVNAEVAYLITPGQRTGVGTPGQMSVQPSQTTNYILEAVCGTTISQAMVTVTVNVAACGSGSPTITGFTASPSVIQPGQTSTLSWGPVENAEAAVLLGPEGKKGVGTPGQQVVQPGQTTTYTLLGFCGTEVVAQSVTVTVQGTQSCSGTPTIEFFFANPPVVQRGQSSTLQWGLVSNADTAYLSAPEGIVGIGTPGQQTVAPEQTTTYTLYAVCGSISTQASATVFVQ